MRNILIHSGDKDAIYWLPAWPSGCMLSPIKHIEWIYCSWMSMPHGMVNRECDVKQETFGHLNSVCIHWVERRKKSWTCISQVQNTMKVSFWRITLSLRISVSRIWWNLKCDSKYLIGDSRLDRTIVRMWCVSRFSCWIFFLSLLPCNPPFYSDNGLVLGWKSLGQVKDADSSHLLFSLSHCMHELHYTRQWQIYSTRNSK